MKYDQSRNALPIVNMINYSTQTSYSLLHLFEENGNVAETRDHGGENFLVAKEHGHQRLVFISIICSDNSIP